MTTEILKEGKSFFYINKEKNFPPDSTTQPADYNNERNLSLWITQLNVTSKEQNRIINEWIVLLPKLNQLRYLWFQSKVSQKIFDAVCENKNIEGLYIKWSGIKNIGRITNLTNLKYLRIGSSTQIENLTALENLKSLEVLEVENTKLIADYDFLENLPNLKALGLTGSMWTTLKINGLAPISQLKNLLWLDLGNTKILDMNFSPIHNLKQLTTLYLPLWYPRKIYQELFKSLPKLKHGEIEKIATDDDYCQEWKIK
ncbi:MAG: hypothetical protein KIT80_23050 [Chitinophagaceae bacterium]|nr:hypothetical protein [Chitinophagaceae bacterium]MCW5929817.1 hypothetical protein [Chitinophagaceae bacterium]